MPECWDGEHDIETPYGLLHVVLRGSARGSRPALLTYHDVGLNHKLCFNTLFNSEEMQEITKHFVVCHVDAPGQQSGASQFPQGYQYPSMDQLAAMLPSVVQHFGFKYVIGIGVGAGAYVLAKFALIFPDLVEGLVLINVDPNAKGWIDWAASKLSGLTSTLSDMVLSHLFSQEELANNMELVQSYRQQIASTVNQFNLQLFWSMYNSRRDLEMNRPGSAPNAKTLRCPVMLVVGDNAPAEDGVVECNSKLDPTTTTFLKMADSGGLPQVTQPGKLTEAFKYFLQGMGYVAYLKDRRLSGGSVPSASMTRLARSRTASLTSASSVDGNRPRACTHSESSEAMGQINHTMEDVLSISPANLRPWSLVGMENGSVERIVEPCAWKLVYNSEPAAAHAEMLELQLILAAGQELQSGPGTRLASGEGLVWKVPLCPPLPGWQSGREPLMEEALLERLIVGATGDSGRRGGKVCSMNGSKSSEAA
ncbi:hypothetical protein E2320_000951 [Naja naja]|nr:hypothetical protein E2320_000951 [Naja naja]